MIVVGVVSLSGQQVLAGLSDQSRFEAIDGFALCCGFRSGRMWLYSAHIESLKNSGLNCRYYVIDNTENADLIHARMQANRLSTRYYGLPVVVVNDKVMIRPDDNTIYQHEKRMSGVKVSPARNTAPMNANAWDTKYSLIPANQSVRGCTGMEKI